MRFIAGLIHVGSNLLASLREMLSTRMPDGKLVMSAKRCAYILATIAIVYSFARVTSAVCRWIDKGNDPTPIYYAQLVALSGGSLTGYLLGKKISQQDTKTEG